MQFSLEGWGPCLVLRLRLGHDDNLSKKEKAYVTKTFGSQKRGLIQELDNILLMTWGVQT